jgi:hypothetical protein
MATTMTELPRKDALRVERARSDYVKGVILPEAPGRPYDPSLAELAETYDVVESVLAKKAKDDDWLEARKENIGNTLVPFSVAAEHDPSVVSRSVKVARAMEEFDDRVVALSSRIMDIAEKAIQHLEAEAEDDPVKTIRALRSVTQVIESAHNTQKKAYDPASVRPDNTVSITVNNLQTPDKVILEVIELEKRMELEAQRQGIDTSLIEDADIVEDEDNA